MIIGCPKEIKVHEYRVGLTPSSASELIQNGHTVIMDKNAGNGIGISEARKAKIFTPNFTTKTSGMGLGLAMVKNIVNNSEGKIWFETDEEIGSTFFISFPISLNS